MALEQIGQKLKAAREAQGLSLRQVYEKTKIPVGHLQAIENGIGDDLPETVYVAGFIKRYAEYVGLNGQNLADEFRSHSGAAAERAQAAWGRQAVVSAPVIINTKGLGVAASDNLPPSFKTIYFNILCIIGVLGLVYYVGSTQFNSQLNQQDPSLASLRESTAKFNVGTMPSATNPTNSALVNQAPVATDAKISLSASQHVWVEVKSATSGESLFTGYLEQGDRRDFQDPQGLRVRAGNGGSLTVENQGKSETLGQTGKVSERVFMAIQPATVADNSEKDLKTDTATNAKTAAWTKPVNKRPTKLTAAREGHSRGLDDSSSRQYVPGESMGGGSRSIDVPYRYTEGRLDAE